MRIWLSLVMMGWAMTAQAEDALVNFITGGIGKAERDEILALKPNYNFEVKVALKSGHYVGDVRVVITDKAGETVLDELTDGPFFFAKLEPGSYKVKGMYNDQEQTQSFTILANTTMREVIFRFDGNEEIIKDQPSSPLQTPAPVVNE